MGCPSEFYVGERLTRPLGLSVWMGEAQGVLRAQRSQLYGGVCAAPAAPRGRDQERGGARCEKGGPGAFHAQGEGPVTGGLIPSSPHVTGSTVLEPPPRTQSIYLADMCGATARNETHVGSMLPPGYSQRTVRQGARVAFSVEPKLPHAHMPMLSTYG